MYALIFNDEEKKTATGISEPTIEREIRFQMYEDTLFNRSEMRCSMDMIRSRDHNLFCETLRKTSLSAFDDKRYILPCGISSLPYGHYYILQ